MKQKNKMMSKYVIRYSGASLLRNLLTGEGIARAGTGRPLSTASQNKKGKAIVRDGTGKQWDF